jgi:glyoxylase-like metal-dependent hydrolase (beta-lactamase superfamily II)
MSAPTDEGTHAMTSFTRRTAGLGALGALAATALPAAAQAPSRIGNPGFQRFRVGGLTVTILSDGIARRDVAGFVLNAPLTDVQAVLAESFLPTDTYPAGYAPVVLETPRGLVMFDVGTGAQLAPTAGQLADNMRAAGLDPARVATIVFTHFHGDHITGLTTRENQVVFPNAEIVVPAAEWRFWTDAGNESRSPTPQRPNFANVARRFGPYAGRIRQIEDGQEALPGIRAVASHGHSPGHTSWLVADGAEQLMVLGDVTHRPELFARRPDYQTAFDFDGAAAAETRKRLLDRIVADRVRVTGYHFPFPAVGHFARDGQGYRFIPADWTA